MRAWRWLVGAALGLALSGTALADEQQKSGWAPGKDAQGATARPDGQGAALPGDTIDGAGAKSGPTRGGTVGVDPGLYGAGTYGGFTGGGFTGGGFHGGLGLHEAANMGVANGKVAGIDLPNGVLRIQTSGGLLAIHASPEQIAGLQPGEIVSAPYQDYLGQRWLTSYGGFFGGGFLGSGALGFGGLSDEGIVQGPVQRVDKVHGTVTVDNKIYRAHPEQLESVVPGQFVSLSYGDIGGVEWVGDVSSAGGIIGGGNVGTLRGGTGVGGGFGVGGGL